MNLRLLYNTEDLKEKKEFIYLVQVSYILFPLRS